MTSAEVVDLLRLVSDNKHLEKMKYFKSDTTNALGVRIPEIRKIAKLIKINHELAIELWDTKIHEARILAGMIADYKRVDELLFDKWVADFNSWDLCDQTCFNLLDKISFTNSKIQIYSYKSEEYIKRTAFTLIAGIAIHNKKVSNEEFIPYLNLIETHSNDERNFVKKAVNWALRQIGKRNEYLRILAIETALRIEQQDSKSAKWIAKDALRELKSEKVVNFIQNHR